MLHPDVSREQVFDIEERKLHLCRAKLKASSRTSALLAGFATVAMVEIQISDKVSGGLIVAFGICTTLLVAVHMLALMISRCILPNIEAASRLEGPDMFQYSAHETMHEFIEAAWAFSTVFGIVLFLSEMAILCWVKFIAYSRTAAIMSTIILIPVALSFMAFAFSFYRKLISHKYERSWRELMELENLARRIETDQFCMDNSNVFPYKNGSIVLSLATTSEIVDDHVMKNGVAKKILLSKPLSSTCILEV